MQYVVMRHKKDNMDLFAEKTDTETGNVKPLSFEQYQKLLEQLGKRSKDSILTVQISYFTGFRLREVPELVGFHFHTLRHTYTTNLLSNRAQPKDKN